MKARAAGDEAIDRPADQTEQPQLLAGGRIDREPIRVVGVALRAAHFVGVAVAPDPALAQQPVRRQPGAAEHDRRPPGVGGEDDGGREAGDHLDQAAGDEVHRDRQRRAGHAEIEIARDGEVVGQLRILEVAHAGRAHARVGQPVVEPGGRAIAEVGAHRLVDGIEHLEQDEDDADQRERRSEAVAAAAPRQRARPWRWRTPRAIRRGARGTTHHATASPRSAFGNTPKNFHSLRSRRRDISTNSSSKSTIGHRADVLMLQEQTTKNQRIQSRPRLAVTG